mmetsp:Transcript_58613/g.136309  ORF Transcript_58613/g.136309 Transcript_58613/m.136309 type:complete len:210 (-) Transcript_58613:621-1250(-)
MYRIASGKKLLVRLVHEDQGPERGVVDLAAFEETLLQVLGVVRLDLVVAIEVGGVAAAVHLDVRVVADSGYDLEIECFCFVEEVSMIQRGVVAVEPHSIGTERLDDAEIPAAALAPHRRAAAGHDIVVRQPAVALVRQRRVADAFEHALGGPRRLREVLGSERFPRSRQTFQDHMHRRGLPLRLCRSGFVRFWLLLLSLRGCGWRSAAV